MKNIQRSDHLTLCTYNLHFSQKSEQLIANVCQVIQSKGVIIFCLQEIVRYPNKTFIVDRLLKKLGSGWQATCFLGKEKLWKGMGNCIIWNKDILHLQKTEKIELPIIQKSAFHESLFSNLIANQNPIFQRRAIIGTFKFKNKEIRIVNLHLDHIGGQKQRKKQLLFLLGKMKVKFSNEIICGDFNTLDLLKTGQEKKIIEKILGDGYNDASKESGWTAHLFHIRRKLDYIWAKGFKKVSFKKLDLSGSDHCLLVANLTLQ